MNIKLITDIFSTRELSLLIWLLIGLTAMMFGKDLRKSLGGIFKLLFGKQIGTILLLLTVYVTATLFLLNKIGTWDFTLLKDTIFWFVSVALVLFFSINKAKDTHFFKDIVKESFKWPIALEFFVNFYTFGLLTELILMPTTLFLAMTLAYSQTDKKYEQVSKLLTNIFAIIGLTFFAYVTYKTFYNYQDFLTLHTLFSFLLPPILTILLIPFLYLLALYMNYEVLFIRVDFMTNDSDKEQSLKRENLLLANLNLNRLTSISKKLNKFDFYHSDNLKTYLRTLTNDNDTN
jgi:uncharacterized membrane protein